MAQEKPGQTLQATALVHEARLRLVGADEQEQVVETLGIHSAPPNATGPEPKHGCFGGHPVPGRDRCVITGNRSCSRLAIGLLRENSTLQSFQTGS